MAQNNQKVVMAHGTFDLLHPGHVAYLEFAKQQGDVLVVAVASDEMVRRKKGPKRPIQPFAVRAHMLEALRCVDRCVETPPVTDDTGQNVMAVLRELHPDVFVSVYPTLGDEFGAELRGLGVTFTVSPQTDGMSTTQAINEIVSRYGKTAA